jgi:beta-galactosidase
VAGIYDGNSIRLYLDGLQMALKKVSGNINRTIHPITIGKNHERDAENQPGFISNAVFDEIRIYNLAISPEDLGFHTVDNLNIDNLILWLKLDAIESKEEFLNYGATPSHSATMDGIIFSDRTFQPESWQVKISHAPVLFSIGEPFTGDILIKNKFHFTNLHECSVKWSLAQDTTMIQEGLIKVDIPPQEEKNISVPIEEIRWEPGAEYRLILSLLTNQDTWWAEKGYEITFKEFHLPNNADKISSDFSTTNKISYEKLEGKLRIKGEDFSYEIDINQGNISSVTYQNVEMILKGPEFNVFRPWIVNEISHWTRAEFDEWYEWGLDSLVHEVDDYMIKEISRGQIDISFTIISTSFIDRTIQFINHYNYSFYGTGDMILEHTVVPNTEFPARRPRDDIHWFQKIGLQFELSDAFEKVSWYGKGPIETYPDRKDGAKTGIYSEDFNSINMPYIIPQDFGNKTDVKWLFVEQLEGKGLAIFADNTCNISIDPYENLGTVWYPFQLKRKASVTLNVDHKVSGVGGTPITVRQPYRAYPKKYNYRLRFKPVNISENNLIQLGRQKF